MSAGYPQDKNSIDNRAGTLVVQLRNTLEGINQMKLFLDGKQDADLTALGYSSGDVTTLRAGITDLNALYLIAHAQGTQAAANDFFFNAKNLAGVQ